MAEFNERDWKLFRSKIAGWQEDYMDRLNREYIELLSRDKDPSDNFWELYKRIRADKRKIGVTISMSRSEMMFDILSLINEGVICFDDLNEFSDELKENVRSTLEFFKNRRF